MSEDIRLSSGRVLVGDCLLRLADLDDCSVDSVVTDPPYELGFMGKKWDASGIAYQVELWEECLRVLKPGGHLLAFGGTRTYHRMACAIEDAGFEIRDSIHWVYGSGFPKSLNIGKAIDKVNGEVGRNLRFVRWMRTTELKARDIDDALKAAGLISSTSNRAVHYFNEGQPNIPTSQFWQIIRPMCGEVPEWVDELVARVEAEREVVGTSRGVSRPGFAGETYGPDGNLTVEVPVTLAATDEARRWEGWGTALKPAHEPVVVARKPLSGTVAANVLAYGTGGMNIDGCRVGTDGGGTNCDNRDDTGKCRGHGNAGRSTSGETVHGPEQGASGRWPANVVFDRAAGEALDRQSGKVGGGDGKPILAGDFGKNGRYNPAKGAETQSYADSGGASRFFTQADFGPDDWPFVYQAKPSRKERNAGLDGLDKKREADRVSDTGAGGDNPRNRSNTPKTNHHPTVKPVALMRHLVRLVTPPGGTVLDPFLGSGTTAIAATLEGFQWIGCEMTEEYLPIIQGRITWAEAEVKAGRADKPQYKKPTAKPKPQQPTLTEDGQQQ